MAHGNLICFTQSTSALHDLVAYAKMVFANKPEIAKQFTIEPSYREGARRASKQPKQKVSETVVN